MKNEFDRGTYYNNIYRLFTRDILDVWKKKRASDLENFVIKRLNSIDVMTIAHTVVDAMISKASDEFKNYDPTIIKVTIVNIFEQINSIDKSVKEAVARVKTDSSLRGFELKNIHRVPLSDIKQK